MPLAAFAGNVRNAARTLLAGLVLVLLASCGLGSTSVVPEGDPITDPVVAATVDGRPIYIEDVRAYAVRRNWIRDGEDVESNRDVFHRSLQDLIEQRLFSVEAERRGLDRDPEVRRQLEIARERVLADAIYRDLYNVATDPERIEEEYRVSQRQLAGRPQVAMSHVLLPTRDAAFAALRRLERGEPFEALALELSLHRPSAMEGGYLGRDLVENLPAAFRDLAATLEVGAVGGPIESEDGWHLIRIESRTASEAQSLESLRPYIVDYILRQEVDGLFAELADEAQIVTITDTDLGRGPEGDVRTPEDAPNVASPPSEMTMTPERSAPMGPGGLVGAVELAPPSAPANAAPSTSRPPTPAAGSQLPGGRVSGTTGEAAAAAARPAPQRPPPPAQEPAGPTAANGPAQ